MFGQSHWMHALEQLRVLANIQTHATYLTSMHSEIISLVKETSKIRRVIKAERAPEIRDSIPELVATLPPRDVCDKFLDHYLRLFEPMFRILHIPSFRAEYDAFWEDVTATSKPFLFKLLMAIAIGSIFHGDRTESSRIRHLAHGWIYTAQWWLTGPTERSAMCLDGVQVFCLVILARQANSLGGSSSINTESLLKLAFTLGLHLDPVTFPTLTFFQQEMRRRLWATVLELMMIASLDSTLPLLISTEDFTCGPPSNINDSDIEPKSQHKPESRPDIELTDCSVSLLLQKSSRSRLVAVRKLNNVQPQISYEETVRFGDELSQHCRDISRFFETAASSDRGGLEFHRKFIDSYVRRFLLSISRLFVLQARKDPRYLFARKTCLECCQIISSHAMSLQLPIPVTDDFSLLAMTGSGLFKGPLSQDIIVTLGLEISTQLEEEWESNRDTPNRSDPLLQLSKANRKPHIDILRHIHGQLRQIIALGRPSCKCYILLSAFLGQIDSVEAGTVDIRAEILKALNQGIKVGRELLLQILDRDTSDSTETAWNEDTSTGWMDCWGMLGFDFDFIDPTLCSDAPDMLTPDYVGDGGSMLA
ncbi:hypothetical protein AB5N19_06761 [Seiridium cardinale]